MTNYAANPSADTLIDEALRCIHPSWRGGVTLEDMINEFRLALGAVYTLSKHETSIYVPHDASHIFRPFDFDRAIIRVAIIAQDPYPAAMHACGYALESESHTCPGSARVMNTSLVKYGHIAPELRDVARYGRWRRQGVFMVNRYMTTEAGKPGVHAGEWKGAAEKAVRHLPPKTVVLLLGKSAADLRSHIPSSCRVIEHIHPSPMNGERFHDRDVFKEINTVLRALKKVPIDWTPGV